MSFGLLILPITMALNTLWISYLTYPVAFFETKVFKYIVSNSKAKRKYTKESVTKGAASRRGGGANPSSCTLQRYLHTGFLATPYK